MKTWAMKVTQFPEKHVAKCIWNMLSNMKYILYIWHNCISPSNLLFHMMMHGLVTLTLSAYFPFEYIGYTIRGSLFCCELK